MNVSFNVPGATSQINIGGVAVPICCVNGIMAPVWSGIVHRVGGFFKPKIQQRYFAIHNWTIYRFANQQLADESRMRNFSCVSDPNSVGPDTPRGLLFFHEVKEMRICPHPIEPARYPFTVAVRTGTWDLCEYFSFESEMELRQFVAIVDSGRNIVSADNSTPTLPGSWTKRSGGPFSNSSVSDRQGLVQPIQQFATFAPAPALVPAPAPAPAAGFSLNVGGMGMSVGVGAGAGVVATTTPTVQATVPGMAVNMNVDGMQMGMDMNVSGMGMDMNMGGMDMDMDMGDMQMTGTMTTTESHTVNGVTTTRTETSTF